MARPPRRHRTAHRPNPWLEFFFGSADRIRNTLIGAAVIVILVFPVILPLTLNYLLQNVVRPALPVVLILAIFGYVFIILLKPFRPKKKKNGH